jgi:hypothetical protein
MEMEQVEQRIIRECYARRRKLPDKIVNAPDLFVGLELYFIAFTELNSCRSTGWGPGPIPSWCIDEFAERQGLDSDETEEMHHHIRQMDAAFLKYTERKNKKSS